MLPRKISKTSSLLKFLTKRNDIPENKDSCVALETGIPIPFGAPHIYRSSSLGAQDDQKGLNCPVQAQNTKEPSEEDLRLAGFSTLEGSYIQYPIDEWIRPYEMELIKACVACNTCISLPSDVSSSYIIAVVFSNFMRWFPRCRVALCCGSIELAEFFKEQSVSIGIEENEISIINTYQVFKKTPIHAIGKVVITTPQTLTKIVESSSVAEDLRCLTFCLDAGETSTKYKKIVGDLTLKGIIFRIILSTPSIPSSSRKTGLITKRQQMITSLHISQWIELSTSNPGIRSSAVPKGIITDYWDESNLNCKQLIKSWRQGIISSVDKLSSSIDLPSSAPEHLFFLDWQELLEKAKKKGSDILKSALNCEFLIEAYRILVFHGSRVFYLFCSDWLNNQNQLSQAEDIQVLILQDKNLSEVILKVQEYFSYNIDSSFNICFHERTLNSHAKYHKLRDTITKYLSKGKICGVVLCENGLVSRAVAESISDKKSYQIINIVNSDVDIPFAYKHFHRPISRVSGIFMQSSSVIVILNVGLQGVYCALDTLCSNGLQFVIAVDRRSLCFLENHIGDYIAILHNNYEKLRPIDVRGIHVANELESRRSASFGKPGVVDRYNFKFEPSRLKMSVEIMHMVPYHTAVTSNQNPTNSRRQGFEISAAEYAEYAPRLEQLSFPSRGIFNKKLLCLKDIYSDDMAMSEEELFWNEHIQYLGEVPSGSLSKRLAEYMREEQINIRKGKRKYEYTDERMDKKRIEMYDTITARLNKLLSMKL